MGGLSQVEFFIGERVEVAGLVVGPATLKASKWKHNPHPYTSRIYSTTPVVWVEAVILAKPTYGTAQEYDIVHPEDPNSVLHMTHNMVKHNMRVPVSSAPPVPMAESCLECKTIFVYPVEFNHECGRVCFSCKSTYAWKYFP